MAQRYIDSANYNAGNILLLFVQINKAMFGIYRIKNPPSRSQAWRKTLKVLRCPPLFHGDGGRAAIGGDEIQLFACHETVHVINLKCDSLL